MPSIALGQLQAVLAAEGIAARSYHFNLEFLPWIADHLEDARSLHDEISYLWDFLPGEWLFSAQQSSAEEETYLATLQREGQLRPELMTLLERLRALAPEFARKCAETLAKAGHDVVGFTSSFMQTQPSVAVAGYLKQLRPQVHVLFGGSNAFGSMGSALLELYPVIDVVAHGEADLLIAPLVRALASNRPEVLRELRGISIRDGEQIIDNSADAVMPAMNDLPVPDYDDYFATVERLRQASGQALALPQFVPIETARGCWWGQKSHCTFCGLNADRMEFRSKSPETALQHFRALFTRYGVPNFFVVDNIIDHKYYGTLLKRLAEEPNAFFIHYEIKANLKRTQVAALRSAGVRKVQPGIESLSTPVLQLMKKGITLIQNVQTLKWLTEHGLRTSWYMLFGFPGETLSAYEEVAALIPRLMHICPPSELAPVYIERFSPYQTEPEKHGIVLTGPVKWYRFAFPTAKKEMLHRLAYRFDHLEPGRDPRINAFVEVQLRPLIEHWKHRFQQNGPTLGLVHGPSESALVLGPLSRPTRILRLDSPVATLLRRSEAISNLADLLQDALSAGSGPLPPTEGPILSDKHYSEFLRRYAAISSLEATPPSLRGEPLVRHLAAGGLLLLEADRVLSLPLNLSEQVASAPRAAALEAAHA